MRRKIKLIKLRSHLAAAPELLAAAVSVSRRRLGLAAVGLAVLAPAMDTSVNIAMPAVTAAFGLAQRDIQWIVLCYMLAYGSLMLTCGKLGDLYGHRRVLQAGLALCTVAFTACALSPAYPALLAGRALQGVGIALAISCLPALATALYPENARTWVLGVYGALFALGTALGPLIGSWMVQAVGWSGVFAFRIPLVLGALALSLVLPAGLPSPGAPHRAAGRFDWTGAGLLVTWMSALMLAFSGPHQIAVLWPEAPPWLAPARLPDGALLGWGLAGVGLLGLIAFLRHESRFAEPIIRPALFRSARFAVFNAANLLVNLASFSVLLIVPYFLVEAARLPLPQAGLMLAMQGFGIMAGSWATGLLAARIGPPRLACAGIAVAGAGLIAIGRWLPDTEPLVMAACLLAQGFGVGLFQVATNDSVIATLPAHDRGVAGSLTMMVRTLGIIGGATGLSALFQALTARAAIEGLAGQTAHLQAFQQTMTLAGALLLAGLAVTFVRPSLWR